MDCCSPGSCPRDSLGKNTGMGCHFLLQGLFLTQGLNASPSSPALAGAFFTWEVQPDAYNNLNLGKKSSFYLPSLPQLHQQPCNHQREHAGFGAPQNGSSLAHGRCLTCLTAFWKSPIGRVVVLNLP